MGRTCWQHFRHDADIGVRGIGPDKAEAFEQAALAMMAVITDPARIAADITVTIDCAAPDDELLLVEWLDALIYEMATRHLLFSRFEVTLHGQQLHALARGERVDVRRHRPAVEIKGATLTELAVHQDKGGWVAQCVVDV